MSGNPIYDYVSSAAVSLTMAGNTGISPFLTLFLLGVVEMVKPELLNMGGAMEALIASWWAIAILAALALAEMIGKCIPAVDEIIDSAEVFVVPAISILATMATMGLLPVPDGYQDDAGQGQAINIAGVFAGDGDGYRNLEEVYDSEYYFGGGFMTFTKIVLVTLGIGISLSIHLFKMLIRLSSLVCTGGCCQPFITILEYITVVLCVVLALLAPAFAIIASIVFLIATGCLIWRKCRKGEDESDTSSGSENKKGANDENDNDDVENQNPYPRAATAESVVENPKAVTESCAVSDLVDVPLPPTEAQTY